jgi:hypothetical protein
VVVGVGSGDDCGGGMMVLNIFFFFKAFQAVASQLQK